MKSIEMSPDDPYWVEVDGEIQQRVGTPIVYALVLDDGITWRIVTKSELNGDHLPARWSTEESMFVPGPDAPDMNLTFAELEEWLGVWRRTWGDVAPAAPRPSVSLTVNSLMRLVSERIQRDTSGERLDNDDLSMEILSDLHERVSLLEGTDG